MRSIGAGGGDIGQLTEENRKKARDGFSDLECISNVSYKKARKDSRVVEDMLGSTRGGGGW